MPRKHKNHWRLEQSIWAPRAHLCDAKGFYETKEGLRRTYLLDLEAAYTARGGC